jgi:hypothetical protein
MEEAVGVDLGVFIGTEDLESFQEKRLVIKDESEEVLPKLHLPPVLELHGVESAEREATKTRALLEGKHPVGSNVELGLVANAESSGYDWRQCQYLFEEKRSRSEQRLDIAAETAAGSPP